ncbi:MAG: LysR family transcriptional regulator [Lautropia sp.]
MKAVTLRQLQAFAEVARNLSFSRAALALHLSAPAVTMQVRELERAVGLVLFDRGARKVALTPAGEYFEVHVRRLLATLKEAGDAMDRFARLDTGLLTVGMVSTANCFVPHLLARFRLDHAGVEIRLRVAQNRAAMVELLGANEIDLAIMGRPPDEVDTRAEIFAAHPLVFVARPDHPLFTIGHPPARALAAYDFLAREAGSGTRSAMDRFLREHRVAPKALIEISSNEAIKQAAIAGIGLAFLSLHSIGLELEQRLLRILPIEASPVMRSWYIVSMRNRILSPAAEAFRYFMLEHAGRWLAERDAPHLGASAGDAPERVRGRR